MMVAMLGPAHPAGRVEVLMDRRNIGWLASLPLVLSCAALAGCAPESAMSESVGEAADAVEQAPGAPGWSLVISTAPQLPQDVWFSGSGSNDEGWRTGGSVCLGVLANADGPNDPQGVFAPGDHAMLLPTIVEAGLFGIDGAPVPAGDYVAPSAGPGHSPRPFTLATGESFYVAFDGYVVNTSEPAAFPLPKGTTARFMFTFDWAGEGRQVAPFVLWLGIPIGGGAYTYFPFLDEGELMENARSR
jgi:hypothetical protein